MEKIPSVEELQTLARRHWQQHRPKLCAELKQQGRLEGMLRRAAERTVEGVALMVSRGVTPLEAWQVLREEWILVPQEEPDDSSPGAHSWPA
jgi:hypothetical protein